MAEEKLPNPQFANGRVPSETLRAFPKRSQQLCGRIRPNIGALAVALENGRVPQETPKMLSAISPQPRLETKASSQPLPKKTISQNHPDIEVRPASKPK
jgi:hypothetical protein